VTSVTQRAPTFARPDKGQELDDREYFASNPERVFRLREREASEFAYSAPRCPLLLIYRAPSPLRPDPKLRVPLVAAPPLAELQAAGLDADDALGELWKLCHRAGSFTLSTWTAAVRRARGQV
jgi:hypothetical protein